MCKYVEKEKKLNLFFEMLKNNKVFKEVFFNKLKTLDNINNVGDNIEAISLYSLYILEGCDAQEIVDFYYLYSMENNEDYKYEEY